MNDSDRTAIVLLLGVLLIEGIRIRRYREILRLEEQFKAPAARSRS